MGHSGQKTVRLQAWWLPAHVPHAPRVVIVHGNEANFNHFSVQATAYLLRSIGFAVLLPNLRDHGNSAASTHRMLGWGWDYHLDVLGAWDYAVHDPQGHLGGKADKQNVGLMGFGIGAFASSIALGLERDISAAWLDSATFRPREMLRWHLSHFVGPLAPAFTGFAWKVAEIFAGVNLTHITPEIALLPHRSIKTIRFIAISHNRLDASVPASQSDEFIEMFTQNSGYSIEEQWIPHATGCGDDSHAILPLWKTDTFRRKLCEFWSGVFHRFANECHLDDLPTFEDIFARASLDQQDGRRLGRVSGHMLIL
jgi:hypothetical protein